MEIIPSLYGIKRSNRDFSNQYYWGKNQFNSAFPVALACFMRDAGQKAVYLKKNEKGEVIHGELDIGKLFGTSLPNNQLYFSFESRFEPFSKFVYDELETIDLVVKDGSSNNFIRPIEIKLTTLPDNTTDTLPENEYGSEIVVRSPTMRYMALSMAQSLQSEFKKIKDIFEPCVRIRQWDNQDEIRNKLPSILSSLQTFISQYHSFQQPLLMQPVWKTVGKSPVLADHCLDIFVWSDFALTSLFMESSEVTQATRITRHQRAAVRLARFLSEVSRSGKVYQEPIYDGMSLGNQTDKEFAVSGVKTNKLMACARLTKPIIKKNQIRKIILGGGQKYLSPERRFDAILYFSTDLFDPQFNEEVHHQAGGYAWWLCAEGISN